MSPAQLWSLRALPKSQVYVGRLSLRLINWELVQFTTTALLQSSESNNGGDLGQLQAYFLPILFILDGIHCAARLGIKHEVKAGIFTEATGIAEEGVLLIIVDGPE